MTDTTLPIQNALISVSDKTGIETFGQALAAAGIQILSTGGSAKALRAAKVPVRDVSDYTGSPEIMNGRVKTLHPKIHGGILARRGTDEAVMREHDISPIDLVVVNLYPFTKVTAKADCAFAEAIENIDIGGPTMVRAAAKNHAYVAIVVDPNDYDSIAAQIAANGTIDSATRQALALKAFTHTAQYDTAISQYLAKQVNASEDNSATSEVDGWPETFALNLTKQSDLRYGENPHQRAALYATQGVSELDGTIAGAKVVQGKALSYNNLADADAALECVNAIAQGACVIVKHANPCGVAIDEGDDMLSAYERAFACDSTSAFGGIIAFNRPLNAKAADTIISNQFVEVIIAPSYEEAALTVLQKKPNVRVLQTGQAQTTARLPQLKNISGGLLVQNADVADDWAELSSQLQVVTQTSPTDEQMKDAELAWTLCQFVKSNAIIYVKDGMSVGIGAGQMSRIDSAQIAAIKAGNANLEIDGAVMASDAFFPFRDSIDTAAKAGIKVIIQPGGSIRDKEVIAAADEHGIAMLLTGKRHFRH